MRELLQAPCLFCGYSGAGYYKTGTHEIKCPWHDIAGQFERVEALTNTLHNLVALKDAAIHFGNVSPYGEDCTEEQLDAFNSLQDAAKRFRYNSRSV